MKKVDVPQILISSAAIFGIGLLWYDFNVKVFHTGRDLFSATCVTRTQKIQIKFCFKLLYISIQSNATMSDNKLVKTIMDAATITDLATGIGWAAKKVVKENFTSDPSSSAMNYVKFTAVMAGSIALKQYLEDQKILPTSV